MGWNESGQSGEGWRHHIPRVRLTYHTGTPAKSLSGSGGETTCAVPLEKFSSAFRWANDVDLILCLDKTHAPIYNSQDVEAT